MITERAAALSVFSRLYGVKLMECISLVFTSMPGNSYHRRFRSLSFRPVFHTWRLSSFNPLCLCVSLHNKVSHSAHYHGRVMQTHVLIMINWNLIMINWNVTNCCNQLKLCWSRLRKTFVSGKRVKCRYWDLFIIDCFDLLLFAVDCIVSRTVNHLLIMIWWLACRTGRGELFGPCAVDKTLKSTLPQKQQQQNNNSKNLMLLSRSLPDSDIHPVL